VSGSCECPTGQEFCGEACTDTSADNANCGEYETVCDSDRVCSGGLCVCMAGLTECDSTCVDITANNDHCGECDTPCAVPRSCVDGVCSCADGLTFCNNECVDTTTDWRHCGGCGNDCANGECLCGHCEDPPTMVKLPEGYCIDVTEVTRREYEEWLDSSAAPSGDEQVEECRGNLSFEPHPDCMSASSVCQADCQNHPQVCVDWCDAYAYCRAIGKRLCGNINGGPNPYYDYANAAESQWYNACSSGGDHSFPYGDSFEPNACNNSDHGQGTTLPVGSLTGCQSPLPGYGGVFDLSGNVYEWEDSCSRDVCRLRGGSFVGTSYLDYPECDNVLNLIISGTEIGTRSTMYTYVGFRCCAP